MLAQPTSLDTFCGIFSRFEKPNRHDGVDLTLCSSTSLADFCSNKTGIQNGVGFGCDKRVSCAKNHSPTIKCIQALASRIFYNRDH